MSYSPSTLRLVADATSASAPAEPARLSRWARVASAVCGGAAVVVLVAVLVRADQRALQRLPVHEREALYQRTMENLTSVCSGEGKHSLQDFCRGQAQFALTFPECDGRCETAARELLRTPTR